MSERVALESFRPHWERIVRVGHTRFRREILPSGNTLGGATKGWRGKDRYGNLFSVHGQFDRAGFCRYLGITLNNYEWIERSMRRCPPYGTLDGRLVDRILTSVGEPEVYATLYFPRLTDNGNRYRMSA